MIGAPKLRLRSARSGMWAWQGREAAQADAGTDQVEFIEIIVQAAQTWIGGGMSSDQARK